MVNESGWQLVDLTQPSTSHPEEAAQRRQRYRQDQERRAQLPSWEAALPGAEAALAEQEAAIGAVAARLAAAQAAYDARYKRVVQGVALRDPRQGLPVLWGDDERCEPELSRRRLVEQELAQARAEAGHARAWRDRVVEEIAFIRGTVPAPPA